MNLSNGNSIEAGQSSDLVSNLYASMSTKISNKLFYFSRYHLNAKSNNLLAMKLIKA
ncbi:hypothetical protein [Vibrio splendidus]|uniref:hypothetical protein n=1 Tax=Vibrio splendidus TaxID=29497 RepID=UPI0012FFE8F9|nr:hypothetical protein [Vibrio splendidus]